MLLVLSSLSLLIVNWPRHVELATTNGAGMNGATVANTSIISPFGPVAAVLIIGCQMAYRTRLYSSHPIMTVLLITVCMGKITNKLIIASMTKSELTIWDSTLCPLLVGLPSGWYVWNFESYPTIILGQTLLKISYVWSQLVTLLCSYVPQSVLGALVARIQAPVCLPRLGRI